MAGASLLAVEFECKITQKKQHAQFFGMLFLFTGMDGEIFPVDCRNSRKSSGTKSRLWELECSGLLLLDTVDIALPEVLLVVRESPEYTY